MMNAKRSSRLNLSRYMFVAPAVILLLLVFSISKADIAKKGLSTIKSITLAIKGVTISNDDRPIMHPALIQTNRRTDTVIKTKTKAALKNADTIYTGKSKDGKRTMLITSDQILESVIGYVINGAKATKADVKALDPGKIYSMDIISAGQAKDFVDFQLDKSEVLFVTTDDSETGKKLKARIDKSMRPGVLAAINTENSTAKGTSIDIVPAATNVAYSTTTLTTTSDAAPAVSSKISILTNESSDDTPVAVVTGIGNASGTAVVVTDSKVKTSNVTHVYISKPVTTVRINGVDMAPMVKLNDIQLDTLVFKNKSDRKNLIYLNKIRTNDETTIDGPGDKLLVVDGKVTKSLKNVAADDIKSMSMLKGAAAEKLYGEKAKNGVLVITTKKGSK